MKNIYEKCLTKSWWFSWTQETQKRYLFIYIHVICYQIWGLYEDIVTTFETENKSSMLSPVLFNPNAPSPICFWCPLQLFISLFVTSKTPLSVQKVTFLNFWGVWLFRLFCGSWHFLVSFYQKLFTITWKWDVRKS